LSILFDRGPNSKVVEANVAKLGADLFMLNFVMISHAHRDHTSELRLVASIKPGLKIYIPPNLISQGTLEALVHGRLP
jgi:7,8-dihydropterin-6-yl-methyl-4-(beta-D-ribofuranosyl)aminobenzene 5'-phosphate synthase